MRLKRMRKGKAMGIHRERIILQGHVRDDVVIGWRAQPAHREERNNLIFLSSLSSLLWGSARMQKAQAVDHTGQPTEAEGRVEKATRGEDLERQKQKVVDGTTHSFWPSGSTLGLSSGEKLVSPTEGTCKFPLAIRSSQDDVNWSYSQLKSLVFLR